MPNHVTHRVIVTGPEEELKRFRETCLTSEGEERGFDFNTLTPMPEILKGTQASSQADLGVYLLTGNSLGQDDNPYATSPLEYTWVKKLGIATREELHAWVEVNQPEALVAGQQALDAFAECGHTSWYTWAVENWGTKWNAYSYRECAVGKNTFEFMFDTAWSIPVPILNRLAQEFPQLQFSVMAFDEGWCFAAMAVVAEGKAEVRYADPKDRDVMKRLYKMVYGEDPETDDDDEEEHEALTDGSEG